MKIWILTKTNYFGEVLFLEVYTAPEKAQEVMRTDWDNEVKEAKEDEALEGAGCYKMDAFVNGGDDIAYEWNIFEREISQE